MKESLYVPEGITYLSTQAIHDGYCERCGSTAEHHQKDFYGRIFCVECQNYGLSTSDTILYRYERTVQKRIHRLCLPFDLSHSQQVGSEFFLKCLNDRCSGYLEAVCGAGKTEMLYQTIFHAIQSERRVLITIPRKQVVIELYHRMKKVFPYTSIKMLHEEAKDDLDAPILIATVQQLMRYYHEFDLIIVDEFDAFPFIDRPLLHRLVKKSLKPEGILLVMSATIVPLGFEFISSYSMRTCHIYERFHGEDLDVPKIVLLRSLYQKIKKEVIPAKMKCILSDWIDKNQRIFIYVPTIFLGEITQKAVQKAGYRCSLFTSKTEQKEDILRHFEQNKIDLLISTSILERGVTYHHLNVIVLFSNHFIYTKEMLIQISGRVGRKKEAPHGEIVFISEEISKAMNESISETKKINQLRHQNEV